jgi:hypothetical protein
MMDKFAGVICKRPDTRPSVYLDVSEPTMESTTSRKNLTPTVVGLAIALFALPAFMATYRAITGENHSNWQVSAREFAVFLLVGLLLWIVKRWEHLPLTSIGLRDNMLRTSLLRGLWFAVILLVVTVGLYLFLRGVGVRLGEEHGTVFHPSLLVVTLSMLPPCLSSVAVRRANAISIPLFTRAPHITCP